MKLYKATEDHRDGDVAVPVGLSDVRYTWPRRKPFTFADTTLAFRKSFIPKATW